MNKYILFGKKSLINLAMLSFALTSSLQAEDSSNESPINYEENEGIINDAFSASDSDQELQKKIQDKISSGTFLKGFDGITVQVFDGKVTLKGALKTTSDKEKVEKEVRNMEGVRVLDSRELLAQDEGTKDVKEKKFSDIGATPIDDQLNKKIRDNVSIGWLWTSYKDVTLSTSNGVVTLVGEVNSISDQEKLTKEIQKVEGVKSVKSELQFKK